MKIKNHHKPDTSKHAPEQKSDAGRRNDHSAPKTDKAAEKALHQRESSANLAKVAPNDRNR